MQILHLHLKVYYNFFAQSKHQSLKQTLIIWRDKLFRILIIAVLS